MTLSSPSNSPLTPDLDLLFQQLKVSPEYYSPFADVGAVPADPILKIGRAYETDASPTKVNLGVGIYVDEQGQFSRMQCVSAVAASLGLLGETARYLPQNGHKPFYDAMQTLMLGDDSEVIKSGRAVTMHTLGGTQAVRMAAELCALLRDPGNVSGARTIDRTAYVSDPTWENHNLILKKTGFDVGVYPYYNPDTKSADVDGVSAVFSSLPPRTAVILQVCCHNPTGCDPTPRQWCEWLNILNERQALVIFDAAYVGFGSGVQEDLLPVRLQASSGASFFVASSCSKNFSMYENRLGSLTYVGADKQETEVILSHFNNLVRGANTSPAAAGAAVVSEIIFDPMYRKIWEAELLTMRDRIQSTRDNFCEALYERGVGELFEQIRTQRGMFAFSGFSPHQVARLASDFHIYALENGRILVPGINPDNIEYVADAFAAIVRTCV